MNSNDYDPLSAYYAEPSLAKKIRALAASRGFVGNLLLVLLLMAGIILLFGHSLWNPLVFDDANVLNESILQHYGAPLSFFDLRWLSYGSFGWTYNLFGLNWFWYRFGNLGLHVVTSVLLFLFFYRLLNVVMPKQDSALHNRWLAFFAALIFAWHPVTTYGVAYLVQRSTLMATLFSIAALLCYLEALAQEKVRWLFGSVFFYFLAISSKESSIMLPGVAIALSLLLRKPSFSRIKQLWLPLLFIIGIGVFAILRSRGFLGSFTEPNAFEIFTRMDKHGLGPNLDNAYPLSIITQCHLFFSHILLWLVPYTGWMSIDIRQPFATQMFAWPQFAGFVAFIVYPLVAARLLLKGGRPGLLGFGMLFPWILYLTELSTIRIQEPFVLYRDYLWMSGLPLALLAVLGFVNKKTAATLLSIACLVLAPLAWNRLDTFSSEIKLWTDAIQNNLGKINQGAERSYNSRGFAYNSLGKYQEALDDFRKAYALNSTGPGYANMGNIGIVYFQINHLVEHTQKRATLQSLTKSLELKPDADEIYVKRGALFVELFRPDLALNDFDRAIQLNQKNEEALIHRGRTYSSQGKLQEAFFDLTRAIGLNPKSAHAYMTRGIINTMLGRGQDALDDFDKAVLLDSKNAEIYFSRGNTFVAMRRYQDALMNYNKAIELDPRLADAYVNRGAIFMTVNQLPEALAEFDKALAVNPDIENAYMNRAKIHVARARDMDAMSDYEKVLNLNGQNHMALLNRGVLLLRQHRLKEAVESFRRSCAAGNTTGCEREKEASTH